MLAKNLLEEWEEFNLFKLKFRMLDHVEENWSLFSALNI